MALDEKDTFLFSEGKGALGYRNANPNSLFTGMNLGKRIDNLSLSFSGTLGQSRMDNANHSLMKEQLMLLVRFVICFIT